MRSGRALRPRPAGGVARAGAGGRPEEAAERGTGAERCRPGGAPPPPGLSRRSRADPWAETVLQRTTGDKAEGGAELAPPHPGADRGGCAVG